MNHQHDFHSLSEEETEMKDVCRFAACSVARKLLRRSVGSVLVLVVLLTGLAVAGLLLRTEA